MSQIEWILSEIAKEVSTCKLCTLSATRINSVPGEGSPNATIMFVGEGPGANEDKQGRPFVGQAGKLLDHLLATITLKREDVFIANIVKCRPPQNRVPAPEEVKACRPYLNAQIAVIKPRVIVTLGSSALKTLLGSNYAIGRVHGKLQIKDGIRCLPMYHPAAYLHKRSPDLLEAMKKDFQELKKLNSQLG
jgi:uracil-DNA glycosylase